ncbi:BioY [Oceaniovalibus guishaninsula JLT2003]|uniref:Biotin transporter n=1 Tax=Oceaniovalibus guishaninsula JLT2003 TaxID=1231392 RepID=K2HR32_9RHOB|nr:biotin transporter BioY [Oceaniovalibus guishaninsula]EKE45194.1 BioY [Oceaniovalibus guishaninsula JLT2003]
MNTVMTDRVLAETVAPRLGASSRLRQAALVALGITALVATAKVQVPVPGSPVAIGMGTFAVLCIGAAYGPRLGLTTILGYMLLGLVGMDVFQSSTADLNGIAYMTGSTGGYLLGYVLATAVLGLFARAGWDRSVGRMAVAMVAGNVAIYVPGLLWLGTLYGWDQPIIAWGLTPFLLGDAIKLALAALLLPALWKMVGSARR